MAEQQPEVAVASQPQAFIEAGNSTAPVETKEPAAPADAKQPDAPIEADIAEFPHEDEGGFDERVTTYTTSLASSVLEYPTEHGRRYHAYRPGKYIMPNDQQESVRLDLLHLVMVKTAGEVQFLAPIDESKVHRALDIGTGTGIWAIEFGEMFPAVEVMGNDLSPIQPSWVPPNVKFEVDDVESEWTYQSPFDYIFSRYMCGSIADWQKLVRNIHNNLAPGGWVEFQDYDMQWYSDDDTLKPSHDTSTWLDLLLKSVSSIGRNPSPGPELSGWVKDAGFENVTEKVFKMPIGPWPKDRKLKEIGLINAAQVMDGLEGFSMRALCGVAGWREEEVQVLLAKVRKEIKGRAFHAYVNYYVVYAQKK